MNLKFWVISKEDYNACGTPNDVSIHNLGQHTKSVLTIYLELIHYQPRPPVEWENLFKKLPFYLKINIQSKFGL